MYQQDLHIISTAFLSIRGDRRQTEDCSMLHCYAPSLLLTLKQHVISPSSRHSSFQPKAVEISHQLRP